MRLCDVTLREGDQLPGRDYGVEAKLTAGRALDRLGVDLVQAGFPATGKTDQRAVGELAASVDAGVVGLARALDADVDAALAAGADVVEVFVPVTDRMLEYTLGTSLEAATDRLVAAAERARDGGAGVRVTLADAFRADVERVVAICESFPGAGTVTLADTVGARTPATVRSFLATVGESVDLARVGVHFHDDLGVATANALAAGAVGVGWADVSVAGMGERAGNPALEEVVAAGTVDAGLSVAVDESALVPACRAVLDALGESVPPRKAVLGDGAFEHESGIHTAAMLAEPSIFEPFDPARFGGERRLLFGAGTGGRAARTLLSRAGVAVTDDRVADYLGALGEVGPVGTDEAVELARERYSG